jgi:nitronate monooxygenase
MSGNWFRELGMKVPVVQAGMGGGLSDAPLATAVSRAGGLGTVGIMPPAAFRTALAQTRDDVDGAPFAANLLMPFVRSAHVAACIETCPSVVVMFYGFDAGLVRRLQGAGIRVWHQVGTAAQARRALANGVDGLIAQGVEAGGHLGGNVPLHELVPAVKALAGSRPVLAAGGIHDADSAGMARRLGADGVVSGTRFLLTPESGAHPDYQARLLESDETLRTLLFGLAWPAYHRVVPNAATRRWCRLRPEGPRWVQQINTLAVPARRVLSLAQVAAMTPLQRLSIPFYSAVSKTRDMADGDVDVTPLYAGTGVNAMTALLSADRVVASLAAGFSAAGG